jgi:hypothetical protein
MSRSRAPASRKALARSIGSITCPGKRDSCAGIGAGIDGSDDVSRSERSSAGNGTAKVESPDTDDVLAALG